MYPLLLKRIKYLFFVSIIFSCSSSPPVNKEVSHSTDTKFISLGYLSFDDGFQGCKKGMKIYIQNRDNNFFKCNEDIPALNANSIILLQKDLKGTPSEKYLNRGFSTIAKLHAESNFSQLRKTAEKWYSSGLESYVLSQLVPPFKFNECRILNYKIHKIVESGQSQTYSIEFEGDFESYCEYEDSNGIKFYGRDILRLERL